MTFSPEVAEMIPGLMAIALSIVGLVAVKIIEVRRARARRQEPRR